MAIASRLTLDHAGELDRASPHPRKAARSADPPLDGVGQDLCKVRQRQGKDLAEVGHALKIRPHHLIAIEEGRFDVLPARVYAIGYVRSYAAYLGLDAAAVVDRLKSEMATRGGARDFGIDWEPVPAEHKLAQGRMAITAMMAVALLYGGYQVLASAVRAVEPPVMQVPERLLAEARLAQKAVAAPPMLVEPPPVRAVLPAPVVPPEPIIPIPTEIVVTPQAAAPIQPPPRAQAALPPGRRYGAQNRNSRITLRVHRPTYVAVQGTRNRIFLDRALFPGDTYRVPNVVGLRFSAQDAGAVEVILDGSSIGFAGDDGAQARALSLNPQAIVDRRQRG